MVQSKTMHCAGGSACTTRQSASVGQPPPGAPPGSRRTRGSRLLIDGWMLRPTSSPCSCAQPEEARRGPGTGRGSSPTRSRVAARPARRPPRRQRSRRRPGRATRLKSVSSESVSSGTRSARKRATQRPPVGLAEYGHQRENQTPNALRGSSGAAPGERAQVAQAAGVGRAVGEQVEVLVAPSRAGRAAKPARGRAAPSRCRRAGTSRRARACPRAAAPGPSTRSSDRRQPPSGAGFGPSFGRRRRRPARAGCRRRTGPSPGASAASSATCGSPARRRRSAS